MTEPRGQQHLHAVSVTTSTNTQRSLAEQKHHRVKHRADVRGFPRSDGVQLGSGLSPIPGTARSGRRPSSPHCGGRGSTRPTGTRTEPSHAPVPFPASASAGCLWASPRREPGTAQEGSGLPTTCSSHLTSWKPFLLA